MKHKCNRFLCLGLAGELAEQLRVLLAATQATRLAGDYRSGKRISMRKVISYIASHFRKDKIWLRRTRPDKRVYQVTPRLCRNPDSAWLASNATAYLAVPSARAHLQKVGLGRLEQVVVAVDDSRSMREGGRGSFALEALALLAGALTRLEVGDLAVLRFGGAVGVLPLHTMGTPWTPEAGAHAAASLRFNQVASSIIMSTSWLALWDAEYANLACKIIAQMAVLHATVFRYYQYRPAMQTNLLILVASCF